MQRLNYDRTLKANRAERRGQGSPRPFSARSVGVIQGCSYKSGRETLARFKVYTASGNLLTFFSVSMIFFETEQRARPCLLKERHLAQRQGSGAGQRL